MQVIQCLYKIGVRTFFTTNFIKLPCIGTVSAAYYYHSVDRGGNFLCFPLSLLSCVADSIRNSNIIDFFLENFNYIMKFIVVKCRLRHNTELFSLFGHKIFGFFCRIHDDCLRFTPSHNSFHFRMPRIANHYNLPAFSALFLYNTMNPFDKGTGRIYQCKSLPFYLFINIPRHAVRPYHNRPALYFCKLIAVFYHPDALFPQLLHHFLIVDDCAIRINIPFSNLPVNRFHRTLYTKTEAHAFRCQNFQLRYLFSRARIFSQSFPSLLPPSYRRSPPKWRPLPAAAVIPLSSYPCGRAL